VTASKRKAVVVQPHSSHEYSGISLEFPPRWPQKRSVSAPLTDGSSPPGPEPVLTAHKPGGKPADEGSADGRAGTLQRSALNDKFRGTGELGIE
jgi:hypothetical protein